MIYLNGKAIPILYLFVYKELKEGASNKFYVSYSQAKKILKNRFYRIPHSFHYVILKELGELRLIKKIGGKNCMKFEFVGKDAEKLLRQYLSLF